MATHIDVNQQGEIRLRREQATEPGWSELLTTSNSEDAELLVLLFTRVEIGEGNRGRRILVNTLPDQTAGRRDQIVEQMRRIYQLIRQRRKEKISS